MIAVAVFASGSGSNAESLIRYFDNHPQIKISLVVCNNPHAGVITRAQKLNTPVEVITNKQAQNGDFLFSILQKYSVEWIALAGYLRKIPNHLIDIFHNKILNIHPSLLPKYGGKGMYGMQVHQAVITAHEKETGLTIHFVNEQYDQGAIIFQYKFSIETLNSPEQIADAIRPLENKFYPIIVEKTILGLSTPILS